MFDIFNRDAFVFWDPADPRAALELVRQLETNSVAYMRMLVQPVLAAGNITLERYFSVDASIGGGKLGKRIRSMVEALPSEAT